MLNLPHLQAKKIQYFYEPAFEDRHKPLLYSFSSDNTGDSNVVVRQSLFNDIHFFTNNAINKIYDLKDGDARDSTTGSLRKSHVIDLFRAGRHAGGRNFKLRERIFPKEINAGRTGLLKRPDYHEVQTITDIDLV